ncbi:MAG: hypothetical protein AAFP84_04005, partial [Actinomycetota bacterium]
RAASRLAFSHRRMRVSPRTLVELTLTAAAAIVIHHAIVLNSAIDQYDPDDATLVATNPALEVAVAVGALGVLHLVRFARNGGTDDHPTDGRALLALDDRDPIIFAADRSAAHPVLAALLFLGVAPLAVAAIT